MVQSEKGVHGRIGGEDATGGAGRRVVGDGFEEAGVDAAAVAFEHTYAAALEMDHGAFDGRALRGEAEPERVGAAVAAAGAPGGLVEHDLDPLAAWGNRRFGAGAAGEIERCRAAMTGGDHAARLLRATRHVRGGREADQRREVGAGGGDRLCSVGLGRGEGRVDLARLAASRAVLVGAAHALAGGAVGAVEQLAGGLMC